MKSTKEVSKLTGVSVRTLQYYDEIGLLKPCTVKESGYRYYNDADLEKLQQILFFKELDFQLKDIKEIMQMPDYNKTKVFQNQKKLLTLKRDRINRLLTLLEQLEKGEVTMSFKEFDMSNYIAELEHFKSQNTDAIIKYWGSIEHFDEFIQKVQDNESEVAKIAIQQFGSIEKYTEAMKYNMEHFNELMKKVDDLQINQADIIAQSDALYTKLTSDLSKDVASSEIQELVTQIIELTAKNTAGVDMGSGFWDMVIQSYSEDIVKQFNDEKYGKGSSEYIAKALRYHFS
ncbi:MAG: MerR family transcriptional regulator [Lachnospiraceae bacterium]|nr:MerR family transcriptional regulator [Lachnospiraceae bacterium]